MSTTSDIAAEVSGSAMSTARSTQPSVLAKVHSFLLNHDDGCRTICEVSIGEFDSVLGETSKLVEAGTLPKSSLHRLQLCNGTLIIRERPLPQHERVSRKMLEILLIFNMAEDDPFYSTGSARVRRGDTNTSLEADEALAFTGLTGNPQWSAAGVTLPTIIVEMQLSECWKSMDETTQGHLNGNAAAVVINIFACRSTMHPCPSGLPGGMVTQLFYLEYRKDGPRRANGRVRPSVVKSFGSTATDYQISAMQEASGTPANTFVLDNTGACNAPNLPDFLVVIPGRVLWSTVPADFLPQHASRNNELVIDLFTVRRALQTVRLGL